MDQAHEIFEALEAQYADRLRTDSEDSFLDALGVTDPEQRQQMKENATAGREAQAAWERTDEGRAAKKRRDDEDSLRRSRRRRGSSGSQVATAAAVYGSML